VLKFIVYYSVRQTKKLNLIKALHEKCFPGEAFYEDKKNWYWVVMDRDGNPVGFGIATDFGDGVLFLSRAGVLPKFRGHGIHKRVIEARIRCARRRSIKSIITYTAKHNAASVNGLIAKGFKSYEPEYKYVGADFNYWILELW